MFVSISPPLFFKKQVLSTAPYKILIFLSCVLCNITQTLSSGLKMSTPGWFTRNAKWMRTRRILAAVAVVSVIQVAICLGLIAAIDRVGGFYDDIACGAMATIVAAVIIFTSTSL